MSRRSPPRPAGNICALTSLSPPAASSPTTGAAAMWARPGSTMALPTTCSASSSISVWPRSALKPTTSTAWALPWPTPARRPSPLPTPSSTLSRSATHSLLPRNLVAASRATPQKAVQMTTTGIWKPAAARTATAGATASSRFTATAWTMPLCKAAPCTSLQARLARPSPRPGSSQTCPTSTPTATWKCAPGCRRSRAPGPPSGCSARASGQTLARSTSPNGPRATSMTRRFRRPCIFSGTTTKPHSPTATRPSSKKPRSAAVSKNFTPTSCGGHRLPYASVWTATSTTPTLNTPNPPTPTPPPGPSTARWTLS